MTVTTRWWYAYFRRWIARGYQPLPSAAPSPEWIIPPPDDLPSRWLLAFCPTFVGGENAQSQREILSELAAQLYHTHSSRGMLPYVLLVGMQHRPEQHAEAVRRLHDLAAHLQNWNLTFAAFCLSEFGKVKSVNVALQLAHARNAEALLQIDDDIHLEPGCVTTLYHAYQQYGGGLAVGASKIGLARQNTTSRLLRWLKAHVRAATNYPHACCMLLDPRLLPTGIPRRYISDDGYICFHLLRPQDADPFRLLRLVPEAQCVHYVGGPAAQSVWRIRRMLLNHHVFMADFPLDVARFFFREMLFPGFWPLGSKPQCFSLLRWSLQLLYFAWFAAVGLELAIRGLFNRPLRHIRWMGVEDRQRPQSIHSPATEEANP